MKLSLKACRVNVNATAKEMATDIGVCEETIYNWESGRRSPRTKDIPKILNFFASRGFEVSVDHINFLP